jgi:DNA-binding NarL/FixJ family response regulator
MFDLTQWDKLNADRGGKLENRIDEIRLDRCALSRKQAIIVVAGEMGKNPAQIAQFLDIDEHTVHNYHTLIRKKKDVSKEEEPEFDMLFRPRHRKK